MDLKEAFRDAIATIDNNPDPLDCKSSLSVHHVTSFVIDKCVKAGMSTLGAVEAVNEYLLHAIQGSLQ